MSTIIGLSLAFASAVFKSTKSITTKIAAVGTDEYVTSFATRMIGGLIFLGLVVFLQDPYLPSGHMFWMVLIVNSVLLGSTTLLFTKALKISDVSIVSPIMALLPVVVALPAFFILGETPSLVAAFGLGLVGFGAYSLNIDKSSQSYLEPIYAITNDRGVQLAFVGLIIAALIPSFDKIGIGSSDPFTWVLFMHFGSGIFILLLMLTLKKEMKFSGNMRILAIVGVSNALIWVFQSHAYTMTQVSYVQAVKRVSILISVIVGHYYFEEKNIRERLFGASLILIGIVLIVLGAEFV